MRILNDDYVDIEELINPSEDGDYINIEDVMLIEDNIISDKNETSVIKVPETKSLPNEIIEIKKEVAEPLVNEPLVVEFPNPMRKNPTPTRLWQYFYDNPELNSIFTAITEDIISDGYKLYPKENKSGRNKKIKADEFLRENHAKEQFYNWVMDALITGDGLLYKMGNSKISARNSLDSVLRGNEIKSFTADEIINDITEEDEDIFSTRKFLHIPMSTMEASFDIHGDVNYWKQRVGGNIAMFTPEEIIHLRLMRNEGKFYGYTPLYSLQTILDTLKDMRDVLRDDLNGGGIPNSLFVFAGEAPTSKNVLSFAKQLRLFAWTRNKHKSLIATTVDKNGVQHIRLKETLKDMEYHNLSVYLTQIIVMVWKIPAKRLSNLLIQAGAKGESTDEGYWRQISHAQDMIEDMINMYLLDDFGVELRFNRSYLQDEVRETTNMKIKCDISEQLLSLGVANEKWVWDYLNIPEEARGEGYKNSASKLSGKAYASVSALNSSPEKQEANMERQGTQIDNQKSEKLEIDSELKSKQIEKIEGQIKVLNKLMEVR